MNDDNAAARLDCLMGMAAVAIAAAAVCYFLFVAFGGSAAGADFVVRPAAPAFTVRAAAKPTPKPAPTSPVLLGWNVPQPDGSLLFVPVSGAAPEVPAPVASPFVQPPATTPVISAQPAAPVSTSSPAITPMGLIGISVRGVSPFGVTDPGCTSYG